LALPFYSELLCFVDLLFVAEIMGISAMAQTLYISAIVLLYNLYSKGKLELLTLAIHPLNRPLGSGAWILQGTQKPIDRTLGYRISMATKRPHLFF
jgi:hypothetical protein